MNKALVYLSTIGACLLFSVMLLNAAPAVSQPADRQVFLDTVLSIINEAEYTTLITVGEDGFPRARTVKPSGADDDLTIWVATRPQTRKVHQISHNPKVELHYIADDYKSYVSIMGLARLHSSPKVAREHDFFPRALRDKLWPGFPNEYQLFEIKPVWIEALGRGIKPDRYTWKPQSLCIDAAHCPKKP
ncbi:Uncharacterised protein [BD1-7 clade bacterium]|uniref:Pyridoxamine 5'-phosphate oxidase N-terminal domain-containing protein n=1 Tax=BD1-7 clade bacterium TaxID=2029982 RepID=A0A5S9QP92_9GAMM|nr:Uncharacterised protein [BD1-7 clade bacterium]